MILKNLFAKSPTINSLQLDNLGWSKDQKSTQMISWYSPNSPALLSLNFFRQPPDIPTLKDINQLRDFYRTQVANQSGGLIKVEPVQIQGTPSIETIFKIPDPSQMLYYIGSLTIPFKDYSYVIKIQAMETPQDQLRATFIMDKLLREGKIHINQEEGYPQEWTSDPYDASFRAGSLMNLSENIEYDMRFPKHPLTIVRSNLLKILNSITFEEILTRIPSF